MNETLAIILIQQIYVIITFCIKSIAGMADSTYCKSHLREERSHHNRFKENHLT